MTHEKLRRIGWKNFFQQQLSEDLDAGHVVARVSAHFGSRVHLLGCDGEFDLPVQLVEAAGVVAVGDWLVLDEAKRAVCILERQTVLHRKAAGPEAKLQLMAANIDTIFIVTSCNQDFNPSRIERYLALTIQSGATPVVVLTKADLCDNMIELRRTAERLHPGLLVETLDARDQEHANVLLSWCGPGSTVALLGSSGVGKSTLANSLGAGQLQTGGIRDQDGKGRHTTTVRSLHCLPSGGVLIDTPGMRELQLAACEDGVADLFEDVLQIATKCRFSDCQHDGEPGCAVAAAQDAGEIDHRRVVSFKKLMAEQAHNARSIAERRERDRGFGRMIKSVLNDKRRRRDTH